MKLRKDERWRKPTEKSLKICNIFKCALFVWKKEESCLEFYWCILFYYFSDNTSLGNLPGRNFVWIKLFSRFKHLSPKWMDFDNQLHDFFIPQIPNKDAFWLQMANRSTFCRVYVTPDKLKLILTPNSPQIPLWQIQDRFWLRKTSKTWTWCTQIFP